MIDQLSQIAAMPLGQLMLVAILCLGVLVIAMAVSLREICADLAYARELLGVYQRAQRGEPANDNSGCPLLHREVVL